MNDDVIPRYMRQILHGLMKRVTNSKTTSEVTRMNEALHDGE